MNRRAGSGRDNRSAPIRPSGSHLEVTYMSHHAIQLNRSAHRLSDGPPTVAAADPLPALIREMPGESEWYRWHGLGIHFKMAGSGPPVLLLHSVDVGASCIEWRRNVEPLAESFTTHAVDMPGFGQSDIPADALNAELYLRFVQDFCALLVERNRGRAIRVVASGHGAAYAVVAATRRPALIDQLVLVAPAGLSVCHPNPLGSLAYHALGLPFMSAIPSNASSRTAILEHLQQDVYGDDVRASMNEAEARYWVTHRKGADRVERARLAAMLNIDLRPSISGLKQPVLLAWGRKAKCPPLEDAESWRELHSRTVLALFEGSGLCPHYEEAGKFNSAALEFLAADAWDDAPQAA
jgi:pimeloyl-ACP methyl ester carboxylesterase